MADPPSRRAQARAQGPGLQPEPAGPGHLVGLWSAGQVQRAPAEEQKKSGFSVDEQGNIMLEVIAQVAIVRKPSE
ncbi:hypothetical protein PG996_010003 [Apiospora saccharicola]|uniref:Uncharacterized protein n=1 Tax=Apiospora saccharicola TaxID=335842 RepID=A0ABR1UMC0_9PEZI